MRAAAIRRLPASTWLLRGALLVLPLATLALALPQWPHWALVALVVVSATRWAFAPEDVAGIVALVLVAGWWSVHDDRGWRLLVVGVLLLTAHLCAVVASYGPAQLPAERALLRTWLARSCLLVVPLVVAWWAVTRLPDVQAPGWVWPLAVLVTLAGILVVTLARPKEPA